MKLLSGHVNKKKIRTILVKLPDKLGDVYNTVMSRIFSQDGEQRQTVAKTALTWITYAKERLTADQLMHVIAVDLDPTTADIDSEDLIDLDILLSSCVGLVVFNKEVGTVRLVHYTTQVFLEERFPKRDASSSMAKTCLTYLVPVGRLCGACQRNYPQFAAAIRAYVVRSQKYKLASYAANYWVKHALDAGEENLIQDILDLLSCSTTRTAIEVLVGRVLRYCDIVGFTVLHFLSVYGLPRCCRALLNEDNRARSSYVFLYISNLIVENRSHIRLSMQGMPMDKQH